MFLAHMKNFAKRLIAQMLRTLVFSVCVSLRLFLGEVLIPEVELQRQVLDAMNCVLYEQLKYKGNELDYYNSLNSYIHQVCICWRKSGGGQA